MIKTTLNLLCFLFANVITCNFALAGYYEKLIEKKQSNIINNVIDRNIKIYNENENKRVNEIKPENSSSIKTDYIITENLSYKDVIMSPNFDSSNGVIKTSETIGIINAIDLLNNSRYNSYLALVGDTKNHDRDTKEDNNTNNNTNNNEGNTDTGSGGSTDTGSGGGYTPANANFVFSPYIDVPSMTGYNILQSSTPSTVSNELQESGIQAITLSFIFGRDGIYDGTANSLAWENDTSNITQNVWGGGYDIRNIVSTLQNNNIDVTISVGGAGAIDPAVVMNAASDIDYATKVSRLAAEFQSIIDTFNIKTLDFDIESPAVEHPAANTLRADALEVVRKDNPNLFVSLTLASTPFGLQTVVGGEGPSAVNDTLKNYDYSNASHVNGLDVLVQTLQAATNGSGNDASGPVIDRVNLMAMEYGRWYLEHDDVSNQDMGKKAIEDIKNTRLQLNALGLYDVEIGVIPLIGSEKALNAQNANVAFDTKDANIMFDTFTLEDAKELYDFVNSQEGIDNKVTLISMWSLGKDYENKPYYYNLNEDGTVNQTQATNGTPTVTDPDKYDFAHTLSTGELPIQ